MQIIHGLYYAELRKRLMIIEWLSVRLMGSACFDDQNE